MQKLYYCYILFYNILIWSELNSGRFYMEFAGHIDYIYLIIYRYLKENVYDYSNYLHFIKSKNLFFTNKFHLISSCFKN